MAAMTGCTPCVMDLYEEEMTRWTQLKQMTVEERREWFTVNVEKSPMGAMSPQVYKEFQLMSIKQVTVDSFLYSFKLPDNEILGMGPGQHCIMRLTNEDGMSVTRQYTPINPLDQTKHFDVIIKLYEDGQMSKLIKNLQVGSDVQWKGPFGDFVYQPNQFDELVMLACGTGIAPMIQVISSILCNEDDMTRLYLLYASRSQHHILLKNLLDEFSSYWNFNVRYYLSGSDADWLKKDKGLVKYGDEVEYGRIDKDILESELSGKTSNVRVLICGTKSFEKDMVKYLLSLGYQKDNLYKF
jgi:cytochrome-b5 reductase